jgi:hypothetical protein
MTKLIDFSFSRFSGASIKAAGFSGALRYLSSTPSKCLTAEEATDFIANGLSFGLVWEDTANAALLGFNQGVSDAKKALSQANTLGYPGCVIYFAVDFDSTPEQQTQIDDYLRGVASIIGLSKTGVYGSFYVCQRCQTSGTAAWFWQTLAWSGGQIASNIHIYQNGQSAMGGGADVDEARQENWGQISPNDGTSPPEPIQTTPVSIPAPVESIQTDQFPDVGNMVVDNSVIGNSPTTETAPNMTSTAPEVQVTYTDPAIPSEPVLAPLAPQIQPSSTITTEQVNEINALEASLQSWWIKLINLFKKKA